MVHTALLVIDMQKAFDRPIWGERNNPQAEQQALRVLAYFRKHALPVLHVNTYLKIPSRHFITNKIRSLKVDLNQLLQNLSFKKRLIAPLLEQILKPIYEKKQIGHLVVVGLTLPHCVSTTTRMAANLGLKSLY